MSQSPSISLEVSVARATDTGQRRKQNEDAIGHRTPTDPETLEQLRQSGSDPATLMSPGFGVATGAVCCLGGLVFAAILGAIGAAIMAAVKEN